MNFSRFSAFSTITGPAERKNSLQMRRFQTISEFSHGLGRVEVWRSGCRLNISVAAPFVWRCLTGSTLAPFPHPAHRTGHADRPHQALGQPDIWFSGTPIHLAIRPQWNLNLGNG